MLSFNICLTVLQILLIGRHSRQTNETETVLLDAPRLSPNYMINVQQSVYGRLIGHFHAIGEEVQLNEH